MVHECQKKFSSGPAIPEPVFAFNTGEFLIDYLELLSDIPHVGIDRIVSYERLHCCIHEGVVTDRVTGNANKFREHTELGSGEI